MRAPRGGGPESPRAPAGYDRERTGLVVIRLWLEGVDGEEGLRARISVVPDLGSGETDVVYAAGLGELVEVVSAFVATFTGGGRWPR